MNQNSYVGTKSNVDLWPIFCQFEKKISLEGYFYQDVWCLKYNRACDFACGAEKQIKLDAEKLNVAADRPC